MSLPSNAVQTNQGSNPQELAYAVSILLKEQGYPVDKNRLQSSLETVLTAPTPDAAVFNMLKALGIDGGIEILQAPDAAFMPLIAHHKSLGFGRIVQFEQDNWSFVQQENTHRCRSGDFDLVAKIDIHAKTDERQNITFTKLLRESIIEHKGIVIEAMIASFIINLLALAVSLFSMQVYDRVIPTRSEYTLIILSSGVALMILFETFMKFARSRVMDRMVVGMDQDLSRSVFERLLKVRVDRMPNSVGSLAAQLRGYEQVRGFFTASTLFTLVDIPMSLIFVFLIAVIASPLVAAVPLIAAIIGLLLGFYSRKKINQAAQEGAQASYLKTGILVEAVEGIETIKAGSGNWKFLSKWLNIMNITTQNDLKMRHANDNLNYTVQMLQQISYISIVITGAYVVMQGDMTMGGLIASTILGGRVLAPIMNAPNMLVQYSHAKAAQMNIENLFKLEQDNQGVSYPLSPSKIYGNYQCNQLTFNYPDNDRPALQVPNLTIRAGERVAILGAIGSGKSTLLKLLSGLYAPSSGHILLDGLDISQISRESLSDQVGYLQQDHRLFQGTLRDNLLIGMPTPSDDVLSRALHRTGLIRLVSGHSSGLDLNISEGGKGLSGGQKQLVAFTRLVLTQPSVWLLDEPTASMDNAQEQQCIQVLAQEFQDPQKTLVLSTHKPALLALVNRIIIMDDSKVVMDGPKQAVLDQLRKNEEAAIARRQAQLEQAKQQAAQQADAADNDKQPPQA
ncbi:ATP-binding cassette, subfamily C, LapB [Moraxella cuniculi DSM 21768]|uniref:ATP-binding cassette, subfamily C, LapB n=2 Tax=Moraxella cuniculi TaxID=34061 RepID=A0A1N7D9W9_9GAMM|nr:type I secretion system permease/ATPase [Moraxella cuniculi]OOS07929.1 type I secretion system permease/ATPase [Moraxella cuniculi]SIR72602.1 ATP-binding cassette, subfamily C, LapB [Moraxella cuniculi DSM 21768]VEG13038.1 RTX-I toxin determinant B [Moraxella cuniculi]